MQKNKIIKLDDGKELLILETIELNNIIYLLCEDINKKENCYLYKTRLNSMYEIMDIEELRIVYNSFLNKIPGLAKEKRSKLEKLFDEFESLDNYN